MHDDMVTKCKMGLRCVRLKVLKKGDDAMGLWMLVALAGLYYAMDHMDSAEKKSVWTEKNKNAV